MQIRMTLLALLLGGVSIPVWGADPSPEPPADITCRLESGTATLSAEGGPQGALLKLATPSYSGSAKFTFNGGSTPARLKFRFTVALMMQTFTVTDGKRTLRSTLGWGNNRTVVYWDKAGRNTSNKALAAVTMVMETTRKGEVEVTVTTARGVELGKELSVSWLQNDPRLRNDRLLGTK